MLKKSRFDETLSNQKKRSNMVMEWVPEAEKLKNQEQQ